MRYDRLTFGAISGGVGGAAGGYYLSYYVTRDSSDLSALLLIPMGFLVGATIGVYIAPHISWRLFHRFKRREDTY